MYFPVSSWILAFLILSLPSIVIAVEYGDTPANAYPIPYHTKLPGSLPEGDVDFFIITMFVGRYYRVYLETTGTSTTKNLYIYDSNLNLIKSGSGTSGYLDLTPTQTQNFYIKLWAYNYGEYGSYNIAVIDSNTCSATCTDCRSMTSICGLCTNGNQCYSCNNVPVGDPTKYGGSCYCTDNEYVSNNGGCIACTTLDSNCQKCTDANTCTVCSGTLIRHGKNCVVQCPIGYYNNNGICIFCSTIDGSCTACTDSSTCTKCSGVLVAYGAECRGSCPGGYYNNNVLCTPCQTLDGSCTACNSTGTCTKCSGVLVALGAGCTGSCPGGTYNNDGLCTSCKTLDNLCMSCNSTLTCTACSSFQYALGPSCVSNCPIGTFINGGICTSCKTLDNFCEKCSDSGSCLGCSGGKFAYGSSCYDKCPFGTKNDNGICVVIPLTITLMNTEEANVYLADFSSPLTVDIQVPKVSKLSLVGVSTSVYSITMTKQTDTLYQITIKYSQTIPSSTLRLVYTLNGSPATTNVLRGQWTADITSKYLAYMSEGTKATVEAVNKVTGGSMQGAATGASSMAILGGNPALLWPLLNLFQAFYYLIFIDVNYPANCQMFLKIFSMGSLTFLPNPLKWFVKDIDAYDLPVPKRYNDYNFSGLFLDNAGNELLLIALTFWLYLVSKACRKWIRRLPALLRLSTNKTVEWFEWSGILRSLITSYTDIAQAVFLQMKVLAFYSTVFTLSAVLSFFALGFVVIFPVVIFMIIRRFSDHPELLYIKYETLAKEYNVKKASSRNFVVIWLVRRLIMCLSLVFLQGYPYVQINVLCILVLATIFYSWYYTPYTTKKENICNTLIEILFGCIHACIYILIYDDHNPYFSDDQRLQMGWVIIFACGVILVISMGLSLLEQVRVIIRGIRLLKQLLSKKDKVRLPKKNRFGKEVTSLQQSRLTEQSTLFDQDTMQLDFSTDTSPSPMRVRERIRLPLNVRDMRQERRARLAHRIRELRGINNR